MMLRLKFKIPFRGGGGGVTQLSMPVMHKIREGFQLVVVTLRKLRGLTLHLFSLKAYKYLHTVFSLSHGSSWYNWSYSVQCNTGIFKDVFVELQKRVDADMLNGDCNLLCDGMSIKPSTTYNKTTGCFEGFVDLGNEVVADDENEVSISM